MKNRTVRFTEDQIRLLEAIANRFGITPSDVVRMCVSAHLPTLEGGLEIASRPNTKTEVTV